MPTPILMLLPDGAQRVGIAAILEPARGHRKHLRLVLVTVLAAALTGAAVASPIFVSFADFARRFVQYLVLLRTRIARPVRKDFLGAAAVSIQCKSGGVAPGTPWASLTPQICDGTPASENAIVSTLTSGHQFGDYGAAMPPWLVDGLKRNGFAALKPIQSAVLPLALSGKDVVGIAPTGSGKTLAFLVPALVHASGQPPPRKVSDGPIALVLAPTRELAIQIGAVAEGLLRSGGGARSGVRVWRGEAPLTSIVLYGGSRRLDQLQMLRTQRATHLMVATPGRLLDFVRNFRAFSLRLVSFFVLDEGDRMLDFGFEEEIMAISAQIRGDRQMLFFSATWPSEVEAAAQRLCAQGAVAQRVYLTDDASTQIGNGASLARPEEGLAMPPREIKQLVEVVLGASSDWDGGLKRKLSLLLSHLDRLFAQDGNSSGGRRADTAPKILIFVRTRRAAEELGEAVAVHCGLDKCGVMHGARKQEQRESTLQALREGRLRAVVATDVVGRGVDIPGITHVVIFDFPDDIETYIHRVGRTGRNGERGTSIAFFEPLTWLPNLAHELAEVLRNCDQDVPLSLRIEEEMCLASNCASPAWKSSVATISTAEGGVPDEKELPDLATADELGPWHADGARVWGYSANSGVCEQGRLEFRTGGRLRTTWAWGEWERVTQAPSSSSSDKAMSGGEDVLMSISWNGCTDIVALDAGRLNFELVSRNGRPASSYKQKTLGRALPVGSTL